MLEATKFRCSNHDTEYKVVRVEAPPMHTFASELAPDAERPFGVPAQA
jgi:hypothetical protein